MKEKQPKKGWVVIATRLTVFLCVILTVYGLINGIWYFGYKRKFDTIASEMEQVYENPEHTWHKNQPLYQKTIGEYTIRLRMPNYLLDNGNFGIDKTVDLTGQTEPGANKIGLYIPPKFFGKYDLSITVINDQKDIFVTLGVDENFKYLPPEWMTEEEIAMHQALIDENKEEAQRQLELCYSFVEDLEGNIRSE